MPLIWVRQARPESCDARAGMALGRAPWRPWDVLAECKSHHLKRLSAVRIAGM
jgi:hypothetical protein